MAAQQPDLIAVTGDLVDRFKGPDPEYVDTLCRGLTAIAPTYFVTGNHEWAGGRRAGAARRSWTELGVTVLSNDFVTLERNGDAIVLAGIDDPNGYADQKTPEELAAEVIGGLGRPLLDAAGPPQRPLCQPVQPAWGRTWCSRATATAVSSACPSPTGF